MLTKQDTGIKDANLSREQIINELLREDEPANMQECLHEMYITYILKREDPIPEQVEEVTYTYLALRRLLNYCNRINIKSEVCNG